MQIHLASEPVSLHPDRALWWPRARTLVVADVHLGKGAAFRRAGVAVPEGSTRADLARLATLLREHAAQRLLVLGDLFHDRPAADEPWHADVSAFVAAHRALRIEVIRGNHDRAIERLPAHWGLHWRGEGEAEGPFVFRHQPADADDPRGYTLAGHVHPVLRLRSRHDALRLPVFWLGPARGLLPSFGSFTGGYPVQAAPGDQLVAVTPEGLVPIPTSNRNSSPCMS